MSQKTVPFRELVTGAGVPLVLSAASDADSDADVCVAGVESDTRILRAGEVFVVVPGTRDDGARYVGAAVERGALAIVVPESGRAAAEASGLPFAVTADPRGALAALAAAFHGRPSDAMKVVGITGTNGKTTTSHLVRAVMERAGQGPCALFGTIVYEWPGHSEPARNTTPGAAELQAAFAAARDAGCRSAAMEVSSHALDQRRVEGIRYAAAIFSNLTGDHLDYHRTMEAYAEAKAGLFRGLGEGAVAAVNAEDPWTATMVRGCRARVVRYGLDDPSHPEVTARDVSMTSEGVRFRLVTPWGDAPVASPLLGRYNLMNLLSAAAATTGLGLDPVAVGLGLSSVRGVRGRLESVEAGQPFTVAVDYAHSDDAVVNVLRNLRSIVRGRIITVIGCGGDRDRTKRPRMARAAAELSDLAYFTSDNPRSEDPACIVEDMLGGVYGARNVRVELDRAAAIGLAIREARVGDCVAILGKGHEDYQIFKDRTVHFDDREAAADAVRAILGATSWIPVETTR
ncbi:MAG: UDP-N-acetylmuramoyl-L-alanyl-D-glutamate--2,6-diaminopimelate ligase [Planctomycetes bacterium]|nr:UDP-N-acetylmuramoyl-L-alanyl-D-glutamate--2,6-diaminopimelate ligase [Planctomycetota bacterium]